jgi:putative exporter of polyketide antibiotics
MYFRRVLAVYLPTRIDLHGKNRAPNRIGQWKTFHKISKQSEDLEEQYLDSLVLSLDRLEFVTFNVSSCLTLLVMMIIIFEIKHHAQGYINNLSVRQSFRCCGRA